MSPTSEPTSSGRWEWGARYGESYTDWGDGTEDQARAYFAGANGVEMALVRRWIGPIEVIESVEGDYF